MIAQGDTVSVTYSANTVSVTWINPVIDKIYYLHVVETDEDSDCSNHKVLAIQPTNYFDMDIANVNMTGAEISSTYSTCAPAVTNITWNGTDQVTTDNADDFTYNYGTLTFYYKITATGIANTDWKPVFSIGHNSTGTVTATWDTSIGGEFTGSLASDASANTITVSGSNEFYVKVVVALGTSDEGTSERDIEINLDENASTDAFGNIVTSTNTDTIDQTISARPNTGGISY